MIPGSSLRAYPSEVLGTRYLFALRTLLFRERKWNIGEFSKPMKILPRFLILYVVKEVKKLRGLFELESVTNIKSKAFLDVLGGM